MLDPNMLARVLVDRYGPGPHLFFSDDEKWVKRLKRLRASAYRSQAFRTPGKRAYKLDLPDGRYDVTVLSPDCAVDAAGVIRDDVIDEAIRVTGRRILMLPDGSSEWPLTPEVIRRLRSRAFRLSRVESKALSETAGGAIGVYVRTEDQGTPVRPFQTEALLAKHSASP